MAVRIWDMGDALHEQGLQDGDVGARVDVRVVTVGPEDDEVAAVPGVAQGLADDDGDSLPATCVHDERGRLDGGLSVEFEEQLLSGHALIVAGGDVFANA